MNTCKQCGGRLTAFSPNYNQCINKSCNSIYKREKKPLDKQTAEELEFERKWSERNSGGVRL